MLAATDELEWDSVLAGPERGPRYVRARRALIGQAAPRPPEYWAARRALLGGVMQPSGAVQRAPALPVESITQPVGYLTHDELDAHDQGAAPIGREAAISRYLAQLPTLVPATYPSAGPAAPSVTRTQWTHDTDMSSASALQEHTVLSGTAPVAAAADPHRPTNASAPLQGEASGAFEPDAVGPVAAAKSFFFDQPKVLVDGRPPRPAAGSKASGASGQDQTGRALCAAFCPQLEGDRAPPLVVGTDRGRLLYFRAPDESADAAVLEGHQGAVVALTWAPAGAGLFASAGLDGLVCVWDAHRAVMLRHVPTQSRPICLAFPPGNANSLLVGVGAAVRAVNLSTGIVARCAKPARGGVVSAVAVDDGGGTVFMGESGVGAYVSAAAVSPSTVGLSADATASLCLEEHASAIVSLLQWQPGGAASSVLAVNAAAAARGGGGTGEATDFLLAAVHGGADGPALYFVAALLRRGGAALELQRMRRVPCGGAGPRPLPPRLDAAAMITAEPSAVVAALALRPALCDRGHGATSLVVVAPGEGSSGPCLVRANFFRADTEPLSFAWGAAMPQEVGVPTAFAWDQPGSWLVAVTEVGGVVLLHRVEVLQLEAAEALGDNDADDDRMSYGSASGMSLSASGHSSSHAPSSR